MSTGTPATPATAATPGSIEPIVPNPGNQPPVDTEEKVTLSKKEFAQLQRDQARYQSLQKRTSLQARTNTQRNDNDGFSDDKVAQEIENLRQEKTAAEQKYFESELKNVARDILGKPEYQSLPKSTRELILRNPRVISQAGSAEEVALDIEDFVRDSVEKLDSVSQLGSSSPAVDPAGHKTPTNVNAGGSSPSAESDFEDISKLRGPARSQAVFRNLAKKRAMNK